MPSRIEVQGHVLNFLHAITRISVDDLLLDHMNDVLADPPLRLDGPAIANLTLMLRGFIRHNRPSQTISVSEVSKQDLTVNGLIDLVFQKVK